MTSPVKRRILANLKPGDDVLATYRAEDNGTAYLPGILKTDKWGQLVLYPHPRVIRDSNGDAPSLLRSVEIIEASA